MGRFLGLGPRRCASARAAPPSADCRGSRNVRRCERAARDHDATPCRPGTKAVRRRFRPFGRGERHDGAARVLERLPQAVAGHLPGGDGAGDHRERESPFPHLEPGDRQPRGQPLRRRRDRQPVDEDDEVKGYPRGEDDYVLLEDDEIEAVGLESARTIDVDMFVPSDSIEWVWNDKPHYLTPNDPVGEEAFAVIRDAMAATGWWGSRGW